MRNWMFPALLLLLFTACKTVKIKDDVYKVSSENIELGNIGQAKSNLAENDFDVRSAPKLEHKIRVSVELVPFTKKLDKAYREKSKFNQSQAKSTYVDSLAQKPELAIIRLMDVTGFVNELNADYNRDVFTLLRETGSAEIVSTIAINLTKEDLAKIRQADTYYLVNNQERKYALSLFKQGKKAETLDLGPGTIIAYRLSKFCWAENDRGKWYIADMAEGKSQCKGNTKRDIQEKEEKNLFRM